MKVALSAQTLVFLMLLASGLVHAADDSEGLQHSRIAAETSASDQTQAGAGAVSNASTLTGIRSGSRFHGASAALRSVLRRQPGGNATRVEEEASGATYTTRLAVQFFFGLIYYFVIVSKYPDVRGMEPSEAARAIQRQNEVMATLNVSPHNCVLSCCCSGPRAAHTFAATGVFNYWLGLLLMTCFPCCTLLSMNACTDLNERLGGERRHIVLATVCSFFCSCCVIAQDAEALDLTAGVKTGFCGVYKVEDDKANEKKDAKEA